MPTLYSTQSKPEVSGLSLRGEYPQALCRDHVKNLERFDKLSKLTGVEAPRGLTGAERAPPLHRPIKLPAVKEQGRGRGTEFTGPGLDDSRAGGVSDESVTACVGGRA